MSERVHGGLRADGGIDRGIGAVLLYLGRVWEVKRRDGRRWLGTGRPGPFTARWGWVSCVTTFSPLPRPRLLASRFQR